MKLTPLAHNTIVAEFNQVYKESLGLQLPSAADINRLINLRCSQLPFCPSSLILPYLQHGLTRFMDMRGAYYTTVGTAVHEVMQRYLSKSGRFLADYVCPKCGKIYRLSHQPYCCGRETKYHEVDIDWMGIQGHIDAIFQDLNGNYWILDFKTTSTDGAPRKQKSPGQGYIEQIESYAYLLLRQYGIKVKGVMLCFIKRDNPELPVLWTQPINKLALNTVHKRLNGYRKLHKLAISASTIEEVVSITKHRCSNPYCKYCKLSNIELKGLIKTLFKKAKGELPMSILEAPVIPQAKIIVTLGSPFYQPLIIPIKKIHEGLDHERLGLAIKKKLLKLQTNRERNENG